MGPLNLIRDCARLGKTRRGLSTTATAPLLLPTNPYTHFELYQWRSEGGQGGHGPRAQALEGAPAQLVGANFKKKIRPRQIRSPWVSLLFPFSC